jgi:tetratricopeptide (TPR) repeat protein
VAVFEQALGALAHLPETRHTIEQAIDLRFDLRNAHFSLGERDRIFEHLSAAEPLARALNDQRRLGQLLGYLSTHFFYAGDLDRAIEPGERALAIAEALGDAAFQAEMNLRVAFVCHPRGDYGRAIALTRRNAAALTGDLARTCWTGPILTAVLSRYWLTRCLTERGEFTEAIALAQEAVRIAETVTSSGSLAGAWVAVGFPYLRKGEFPHAIAPLERALGICQAAGIAVYIARAACHLGSAYALSGRLAEAIPLLERAVEHAGRTRAEETFYIAALGEAHLLGDRLDDALALAWRALNLCRERRARGDEGWVLRLLGEIQARGGPDELENAEASYRAALARATELEMRPLLAHCHLGLGKLYRRTGSSEHVREHLNSATTMFREMEMRFWLEQAEAIMGELP